MSEQLHKLLRLSVRSNLTLRIVPAALEVIAALAVELYADGEDHEPIE